MSNSALLFHQSANQDTEYLSITLHYDDDIKRESVEIWRNRKQRVEARCVQPTTKIWGDITTLSNR